jgi:hypothetical protein
MAIVIRVGGSSAGDGFLIAPDGARIFPVPLNLSTDDGSTVNVTIDATPNGAGVRLPGGTISVSPAGIDIPIHATAVSNSRGDTAINVHSGGTTTFSLTAIANPVIWFRGRFEARFATDGDWYNNPRGSGGGTPGYDHTNAFGPTPGWTFALEGEPDFVPAVSVATTADQPVGRVVRFNNPIALRSHAAPVASTVTGIVGMTLSGSQEFTAGDPVIGATVNLGPSSYFCSSNPQNPADLPPIPALVGNPGQEFMAIFECHIDGFFSGKSAALSDRPQSSGYQTSSGGGTPIPPADERTAIGFVSLASFTATRLGLLRADYALLSPAAQTGTVAGRNLKTRMDHLSGTNRNDANTTPSDPTAWEGMEEYTGQVNDSVTFPPNASSVVSYLAGYNGFTWFSRFFTFHSDELCGYLHGSLTANGGTGIPPLQTGIYNGNMATGAAGFTPLGPNQLTPGAIDAILGGAPPAQTFVVTVSPSFARLVVSQAVVAGATLTSRGATLVGILEPDASVSPRDLLYRILPPGDPRGALGACEGTPLVPAPTVGFARVFFDAGVWKMILDAGINGGASVTYRCQFSGNTSTTVSGCTAPTIEVLNTAIDFGNVEQGLTAFRQIVLLNHSGTDVVATLPAVPAPFGAPDATSVVVPAGGTAELLVSFTAGAPGLSGPTVLVLTSNPVVASEPSVTLRGTSIALTTTDAVLVLDRSGSMADPAFVSGGGTYAGTTTKTTLRNQASQVFVDLLRTNDRIGMVRFDNTAQVHMPIEVAGDPTVDAAGRHDARIALMSPDLNPGGSTSIGGGMTLGNAQLVGSTAAHQSLLVLTDGMENTPPWIAGVVLGAAVQVYAVGLGLPQDIDVGKLSAIAGNTGGYMLVTGAMDAQNIFRLQKYFVQILSGIAGDQIVVDPQASISPGETHRIPFYLNEGDTAFDAVLITQTPILQFELEAPDGTRITPANVAAFGAQLVNGVAARYYRAAIPFFTGDPAQSYGQWAMIVRDPGNPNLSNLALGLASREPGKPAPGQTANRAPSIATTPQISRPYVVAVKARSSFTLSAFVVQDTMKPGEDILIVAYVSAFGLPIRTPMHVVAEVTRPDNVTFFVPLADKGNGRFEAIVDDNRLQGVYQIVVRASGTSPANYPIQREQTLTAIVVKPVAPGPTGPGMGQPCKTHPCECPKDHDKGRDDDDKHKSVLGKLGKDVRGVLDRVREAVEGEPEDERKDK